MLPILAIAVVGLTTLITVVGARVIRQAVFERAQRRAIALSSVERDAVIRLMRAGDHSDLQRLTEQLAQNPDVVAARILHTDGKAHASSVAADVGRFVERHTTQQDPNGDHMHVAGGTDGQRVGVVHTIQPIRRTPECRACHPTAPDVMAFLDLDVAINPHATGLLAFRQLNMLLGSLYLVVAVGVVAAATTAYVRRPLDRVTQAMAQVEEGDLGVHVADSGTREVDAVSHRFNRMVERLRAGRAAEAEAQRLRLERVEQLAALGTLAAGLAHELRNPLSGVKAVLDLVASDFDEADERRAALHDASGEMTRVDQIVRDLLAYARPKAAALVSCDLNAAVTDAARLTLDPLVARGLQVSMALPAEPIVVTTDPAMLRQVVVNLLLNASEAGPNGTLPPAVTVETGIADGWAWCRVRDGGAGVTHERASRLFEPFFTTKTRGTGLGLATSRRLMELVGGALVLENPGEAGASFRLSLPLVTPSPERS